jgi:hypothetical protein
VSQREALPDESTREHESGAIMGLFKFGAVQHVESTDGGPVGRVHDKREHNGRAQYRVIRDSDHAVSGWTDESKLRAGHPRRHEH